MTKATQAERENEMSKSYLTFCPRCGTRSYEQLPTHNHCIECLYSDDIVESSRKPDYVEFEEAQALLLQPSIQLPLNKFKKVAEVAS